MGRAAVLVRITAGLMLIPHGWPKLMMGVGPVAQNALMKRGIAPAEPLAVILIAIETIGRPVHRARPVHALLGGGGGGGPYSLDRKIVREL